MKKLLVFLCTLFIGLFSADLSSATLTVDKNGGGDYTTVLNACNASSEGDSIKLINGPNTYTETNWLNVKGRVTLTSMSSSRDTIEGSYINDLFQCMIFSGDSVTLSNIVVRYPTGLTNEEYNYLIYSNNKGGHLIRNCYFRLNGKDTTKWSGNRFERSNGTTVTEPTRIVSCQWDTVNALQGNATWDRQATHVWLDSCILIRSSFIAGDTFKITNSIIYGLITTSNENRMAGDSILIKDCYFNPSPRSGSEFISWDEETKHSNNSAVIGCVIDSVGHVPLLIDGVYNFVARNNNIIFRTLTESYNCAFDNHGSVNGDSTYNVNIYNNTIGGGVVFYHANSAKVSDWLVVRKNIFTCGGDYGGALYLDSVSRDSVDSLILSRSLLAGSDNRQGTIIRDTLLGRSMSTVLIDSVKYPYLKRSSPAIFSNGVYAGAKKYLTNIIKDSSLTAGFSVNCSLATDFWYSNPMNKDSAKIYLIKSLNKSTWTLSDSSNLLKAGSVCTLTTTGTGSTTYYYKLFSVGSAFTGNIRDTTDIDSIITLAAATNTTVIISIINRIKKRIRGF